MARKISDFPSNAPVGWPLTVPEFGIHVSVAEIYLAKETRNAILNFIKKIGGGDFIYD
jgi:hypothetical protein